MRVRHQTSLKINNGTMVPWTPECDAVQILPHTTRSHGWVDASVPADLFSEWPGWLEEAVNFGVVSVRTHHGTLGEHHFYDTLVDVHSVDGGVASGREGCWVIRDQDGDIHVAWPSCIPQVFKPVTPA